MAMKEKRERERDIRIGIGMSIEDVRTKTSFMDGRIKLFINQMFDTKIMMIVWIKKVHIHTNIRVIVLMTLYVMSDHVMSELKLII